MKRSLALTVILVCVCSVPSFAKTVTGHYATGVLEYIEHYNSKDQLNGWYKFYYPTGKLKEQGKYRNGILVGTVKKYYPDGTPISGI